MIKRIEATNYRLLKSVQQDLAEFNVLVGPNASGKTTFLDVFRFISDIVTRGASAAVQDRIESSFAELTHWMRGGNVSFAVEVGLPEPVQALTGGSYTRYEVEFGATEAGIPLVARESLWLFSPDGGSRPACERVHLNGEYRTGWHARLTSEMPRLGLDDWGTLDVKLRDDTSSILSALVDQAKQPASLYTREVLSASIQSIQLDTARIARPVPPKIKDARLMADGSNFALAMKGLWQNDPDQFANWLAHLRTVLRNLEEVSPFEYGDGSIGYEAHFAEMQAGETIRASALSDGTLRLFVLTLLPYLAQAGRIYLVEEPENGLHPLAIEAVYQSLSSVYDGQVLVATHSPIVLGLASLSDILCFAKTTEDATSIVRGDQHPVLRNWQGDTDLSTLFAAGVFG